jgi:hypothetical protein
MKIEIKEFTNMFPQDLKAKNKFNALESIFNAIS